MVYQIMLPGKIRFSVGALDTLADEASKLAASMLWVSALPGKSYESR
jgi:hypothetical protein